MRSFRDGVPSSLSGRKSISFMMLASLTGSSCRRNTKEVFSHASAEPAVTWGDRDDEWKKTNKHPTDQDNETITQQPAKKHLKEISPGFLLRTPSDLGMRDLMNVCVNENILQSARLFVFLLQSPSDCTCAWLGAAQPARESYTII